MRSGGRLAEKLVEDLGQAELIEQSANDQDRPPGPGLKDIDIRFLAGDDGIAAENADEIGEELLEKIFATEVGDDPGAPGLDLAVESEGLNDTDVLVDGAIGGRDFDSADKHAKSITTAKREST